MKTTEGVFDCGDVRLQRGGTLKAARIVYKTFGTLSPQRDNFIVYPTSYSAQHTDIEWLVSPEHCLVPSRYFIVIPNMFTNGLSSSPSNAPGDFPQVTTYDNVTEQRRLLNELFGVDRVKLVYGWSMGAQQAYHWAALFGDVVDRIVVNKAKGPASASGTDLFFQDGRNPRGTAPSQTRQAGRNPLRLGPPRRHPRRQSRRCRVHRQAGGGPPCRVTPWGRATPVARSFCVDEDARLESRAPSGMMSLMPAALPTNGLVIVAKRDCPTCVLVEPVMQSLDRAGPLAVVSQDDPSFPAGVRSVIDDHELERSFRLNIEAVPTLIRFKDGREVERTVGWERKEWLRVAGAAAAGDGLPHCQPGRGSQTCRPRVP